MTGDGTMNCARIQEALFEYMTHELGGARSDLVREHLRKCPKCAREAAEIQATLDALRGAGPTREPAPGKLSDKHRKRLIRACLHPALDWVYRHHAIVSFVVAVALIVVVLLVLKGARIWREDMPESSYEVRVVSPTNAQGVSKREE